MAAKCDPAGEERPTRRSGTRPTSRPPPENGVLPTFHHIIDAFPDGIAVQQAGRIVFANPALARMLGHEPEALQLAEWQELVSREDLPGVTGDIEAALAQPEGCAMPARRRRFIKKSGEALWVELSAISIAWNGVPAVALLVHDRAERERLESGLREADRLAAVGRLAAGVAHEINNPLAYVVANVAFATEQLTELSAANLETQRASISEALREARQGIDRVGQVASDLKTFTRSEERLDLVDLREVLQATVKMARSTIQHRAAIVMDLAAAPRIKARASRLGQVFLNLLVNASHAIADGGDAARVTVRCGRTTDHHAFVEVEDTGTGIAREVLPRIFEPFFTTKPAGVGTGLGLAVCKNIVKEHGGTIEIESEFGKGTVARVVLPPAPSNFVPHTSVAALPAVRPRRYSVLVIDDDLLVLKGMRRLLQAHRVTTASGGRAALDLLEQDDNFDVILCDLMMPEVSGMDVYERLAARGGGLERKIVFVSGGAVTERARKLLESVSNVRLEKPLNPAKLDETLTLAVEAAKLGTPRA